MKLIRQLVEQENEIAKQAAEFVRRVTLSSKNAQLPPSQVVRFLQQTIQSKPYQLYRGIGVSRDRLTPENKEYIKGLNVGDRLPTFLQGTENTILYFSKKKTIAREYSEGTIEIVVESSPKLEQIIVDLANIHNIIPPESQLFDEYDYQYFKKDKEVLVQGPVGGTIIHFRQVGRI